ncbi:MAG: DUF2062 domain-containing protein [Steroidobacteraceae bacterium]
MSAAPRRWRELWRRRVFDLTLAQLRQGITPQKIALTIALGFILGLFPILGATTALCALFGLLLKLNQPIIQLVNWVAAPLQIPGIYLFIRAGEWLTRTPPMSFSVSALLRAFKAAPVDFFRRYGATGLRGVLAWCLIAPAIAVLLYGATLPVLRRMGRHLPAPAAAG